MVAILDVPPGCSVVFHTIFPYTDRLTPNVRVCSCHDARIQPEARHVVVRVQHLSGRIEGEEGKHGKKKMERRMNDFHAQVLND
jgi:hypothetical protein